MRTCILPEGLKCSARGLASDSELRIPAGARDFVVTDDFRLPMHLDVPAVYPHAHYLGKLLEAYATLPDGTRRPELAVRYHYDNPAANVRNPHHPPKLVENGNQATEEMGHLWLEVLPHGVKDRRLELQYAVMEHRLEIYAPISRTHA